MQYKPFGLINRKINTNQNNNNNTNIYNNNNNRQNIVNHNLPKFTQRKNNDNISLLDKIKDKINKENKESKNNISINIKEKSDKYFFNDDEDTIKKNEEPNNKISDDDEDILEKNINMNVIMTKKENNDDEEDILSEEFDEMEESGSNVINTINKINSINVHSNFLKTHYYTGSGFSMNSNNSNSNNSSTIKQKCYTEPDECIIYPKTYQNEPSSGRSNYSGNTNIAQAGSQAVGTENNSNYFGLFGLNTYRGYPIKNSFISTRANTNNSHNLSGHKIDSSLSNESGQSPHYLGKFQRLQYNNSMTNIAKNNSLIFPFTSSITPIDNRHIYTSSFNSNDYRQPFSLNTKTFTNNFNYSKKEKQVIKLEDVALGKETRTTVMIRNIPIKYTDQVLEKELEQFEGKYDCLYMPFDYENGGNKGYAFLNLKSPYHVLLFYEVFNNKCWMFFESKKICELNYANFQGIDEIKKHAKNYKGSKKPNFYINTKNDNANSTRIEIPYKYLNLLLQANPKMKYSVNKQNNLIVVESFK